MTGWHLDDDALRRYPSGPIRWPKGPRPSSTCCPASRAARVTAAALTESV